MKKMNESMITKILADHPNQIFTYNYFSSIFNAGKSSVCEDIGIVKKAFENLGEGRIRTFFGACGGVAYYPDVSLDERIFFKMKSLLF